MRPLLLGLALAAAAAQTAPPDRVTACTLHDAGGVAQAGPPVTLDPARRPGGAVVTTTTTGRAATFEVRYQGFTAAARTAFQRAVDVWADHLTSSVTIQIDARFEPLGAGVLGQAGPFIVPNPPGAPVPNTYYPSALANALAGTDLGPTDPDIVATFNSEFDRFYFGLDGTPPANQFDFVTVVLHELGHGLGFLGSGSVDDGIESADNREECEGTADRGCWGYFQTATGATLDTGLPLIFDRFMEDRSGRSFTDTGVYGNPSRALANLLQSQDLFVAAPTVVAVNGERAEAWAPSTFEPGASFSHWDEILFTSGTSAALMTPRIESGEAYQDPGTATCAFLRDMGWELGAGCAFLVDGGTVSAETAPPDAPSLRLSGPNPFRERTAATVTLAAPQPVRAVLVDALGRHIRTVWDGPLPAGDSRLDVGGDALPAGVYGLVVETGRGASRLSIVRVR